MIALHCLIHSANFTDILDVVFKFSAIIIAIVNLIFLYYFFKKNFQQSKENKEVERKINWLTTLVLDYSLKYLYSFIEDIEKELIKITNADINDEIRKELVASTEELFIVLRRRFIDLLLAVDRGLYDDILHQADVLQEEIIIGIFDESSNHMEKDDFSQFFLNPITKAKTEIIKRLFLYDGI